MLAFDSFGLFSGPDATRGYFNSIELSNHIPALLGVSPMFLATETAETGPVRDLSHLQQAFFGTAVRSCTAAVNSWRSPQDPVGWIYSGRYENVVCWQAQERTVFRQCIYMCITISRTTVIWLKKKGLLTSVGCSSCKYRLSAVSPFCFP